MKPTVSGGVFVALACACFALVTGAQGSPQTLPAPGGLERVDPSRESDDPSTLKGLFARAFDPERWKERLLAGDLDQRERNFDLLIKRARLDPVARAFVEELAGDPKGGELSWTARLALRELGRANLSLQGFLGPDPFGSGQRMQEVMEDLFSREGFGVMMRRPAQVQAPVARGPRASIRSLQVEQTQSGARVRVTETVDGQERTRDFQGASLQEILAANPDLAGKLDGLSLRVAPGAPMEGLRLLPQGRSRPVLTDRLGVIVQPLSASRAHVLGLEDQGLLVERAYAATYAQLLGVKAGDVLLQLDDVVLRKATDIEKVMSERAPDDRLTLVWLDELGQRQEKTWRPDPEGR